MNSKTKITYLRVALVVIGLIFIFGLFPLMRYWPSGWIWIPSQSEYEQMILGIYATLGIFLLMAVRDPIKHLSLIWFTAWSSAVHGGIMLIQALRDSDEYTHLFGDIPALFIIAFALFLLTPRKGTL